MRQSSRPLQYGRVLLPYDIPTWNQALSEFSNEIVGGQFLSWRQLELPQGAVDPARRHLIPALSTYVLKRNEIATIDSLKPAWPNKSNTRGSVRVNVYLNEDEIAVKLRRERTALVALRKGQTTVSEAGTLALTPPHPLYVGVGRIIPEDMRAIRETLAPATIEFMNAIAGQLIIGDLQPLA